MNQHYDKYTSDDHLVWKTLFDRQLVNLEDKACQEYLDCLARMESVLRSEAIPKFNELDYLLYETSGWSIEVVPGHIPVSDFFELLSRRRFPSSTWLRSMEDLDYLEEPDMFHDIFGHIPLLMDNHYASFMEQIGKFGVRWANSALVVRALRSLYWFTIEFGLLTNNGKRKIYGAGILSSYGESKQVMMAGIDCRSFNTRDVLNTNFRTDTMQELYYIASSYSAFLDTIDETEVLVEQKMRRTGSMR